MEQIIQFTRGDTHRFKFKRIDKDGQPIGTIPKKLFFTVKTNHLTDKIIFQKTLNNGITYTPEDNYYHIEIDSEDTNNLPYYEYVFDIEVVEDKYTQTIANGVIKLKRETTFVENEV